LLPITSQILALAHKRYYELSSKVLLRAANAMHLAYAVENRFDQVFTNDQHMLAG